VDINVQYSCEILQSYLKRLMSYRQDILGEYFFIGAPCSCISSWINQSQTVCLSGNRHCKEWPLSSHTGESPGKEIQNRWSLRRCLNTVNDEAEVTCSGSVFQMRAPATGKAREPMEVSRTAGTIRSRMTPKNTTGQAFFSNQAVQRHF